MDPQEPAGCESGEGKSAELFAWARTEGGPEGNTLRTVCEDAHRCAIRCLRHRCSVLSVGA